MYKLLFNTDFNIFLFLLDAAIFWIPLLLPKIVLKVLSFYCFNEH